MMIRKIEKGLMILAGCLLTPALSAQALQKQHAETTFRNDCLSPQTFEISESSPGEVLISWKVEITSTFYRLLYRQPLSEKWFSQNAVSSPAKISGLLSGVYEFAVQSDCAEGNPTNKQAFKLSIVPGIPEKSSPFVDFSTEILDKGADTSDAEIIATDFVVREIETFPEIPKITATATSTGRVTNDGRIEVTVKDGQAPYQFSIDGQRFQKQSTFKNLKPGKYTVTVKDNRNVTATADVAVVVPEK